MSALRHDVVRRTKVGFEYPNGVQDPGSAHTLIICDCACGYRGSVWFASEERALSSFARHLPDDVKLFDGEVCDHPVSNGFGQCAGCGEDFDA